MWRGKSCTAEYASRHCTNSEIVSSAAFDSPLRYPVLTEFAITARIVGVGSPPGAGLKILGVGGA